MQGPTAASLQDKRHDKRFCFGVRGVGGSTADNQQTSNSLLWGLADPFLLETHIQSPYIPITGPKNGKRTFSRAAETTPPLAASSSQTAEATSLSPSQTDSTESPSMEILPSSSPASFAHPAGASRLDFAYSNWLAFALHRGHVHSNTKHCLGPRPRGYNAQSCATFAYCNIWAESPERNTVKVRRGAKLYLNEILR
jgi:hypothetical protein